MNPPVLILLLFALVKSIVVLAILLTGFAYATLLERKLVAGLQVRIGPNRVGPWGLLQPLADGIKVAWKEDLMPRGADRLVFSLAPVISVVMALIAFAVIPIGPTITLFGYVFPLSVASVGAGILVVLGATSLGVYGIVLAGWSSNNKYSLLGGVRSSAQMVSYELSLGLSLVGVLMIAGTLNLTDIVNAQEHVWYIFIQPLGFIVYFISAIAETNRAPFDLPEAEHELVAGYHTEYSGMKFALFQMAEYISMITQASVVTTLFLGGWHAPWPIGITGGPWWFFIKVFVVVCVFIWLRATLPRIRYDRLMNFGWRVTLPLALLNIVLTGAGILLLQG